MILCSGDTEDAISNVKIDGENVESKPSLTANKGKHSIDIWNSKYESKCIITYVKNRALKHAKLHFLE